MPAKTFDDYASELAKLLEAGEAAMEAGSRPKLTAARDALVTFVQTSNDLIPGVIELDDVASSARREITIALLNDSLVADLGSRTDEVLLLTKKFSKQSGINNSAAAAIRLERVRALTDAAIVAVDELKKFQDLVDGSTPDGKKLAGVIKEAITALSQVRQKIV